MTGRPVLNLMALALLLGYGCAARYRPEEAPRVAPERRVSVPKLRPAPTAGDEKPTATLRFRILNERGRAIPGRLTFIGESGAGANLFPNASAAPNELAVRSNVINSLAGEGAVTVPSGSYVVYASRGPEWSVESHEVELHAGQETAYTARLRHEVDTTGWICGDFHLHTLTYSGHGDSNMKERVITLVAEGLEFAVATDHNHHTNYQPTIRELGAQENLTAVVGNEVSVPVGHFNAFPLDPARPVVTPDAHDANALFTFIRHEPNRYGVVPVIQLNHPRWGNIDYFGIAQLDPVTGAPHSDVYSHDFDTLEVFNENEGWGYYDAEADRDIKTGSSRHSVLRDWFNLLNRGHRYAAVGNSDSHAVYGELAGYPRNYIRCSTDEPGKINVAEVAAALRHRQVFTTLGPFVEYWVNDYAMGDDLAAADGAISVRVKVQAASWVDCDRVKVVVNGDVLHEIAVPDTHQALRLDTAVDLRLQRDSWLTLLVEGDDSLAPVVHDQNRPIRPLAVMNPVWIDADGDGVWTSPLEQAQAAVAAFYGGAPNSALADRLPSERGLIVLAAAEMAHPNAAELIRRGLTDDERVVRLLSARAAEVVAEATLAKSLNAAYANCAEDPYLQVAILRAIGVCTPERFAELAFSFIEQDSDARRRYSGELLDRLQSQTVRDWQVVGYFPNTDAQALVTTDYGPEAEADASFSFAGKSAEAVSWKLMRAPESGFLDLTQIDGGAGLPTNAIAYAQSYIHSPDSRTARVAFGTDDGARLWLNDELMHEDVTRHGASPYQIFRKVQLRNGWNRVLFKVENGGGEFGLYLRVFDNDIRVASRRGER